jgi:phage terminase Nu1 subunit (DNA packaging protein)
MASVNGEFLLRKVITLQTLSELSVRSPRQLQRLVRDGIISLARDKRGRPLRGRVVLGEALPKLFEYARESVGDPAVGRFRRARADLAQSHAEMARIELAAKRGEYVATATVEESATRLLTMCRARLLAIPSSISRSLIGKTDFKEIYLIVEEAIHRALHELADFGELARECRYAKEEQLDEITEGLRAEEERFLALSRPESND